MQKRLVSFINSEGLNASSLADRINVQRSSISHIISGRNKPSFDFIQKMVVAFPNLNSQWLITGKGSMYITDIPRQETLFASNNISTDNNLSSSESNINEKVTPTHIKIDSQEKKNVKNNDEVVKASTEDDEIDRIVIFYTNGKFKAYKP